MTLKRSRSRSGDDDDDLVPRPPPSQARRARKSEQDSTLHLRFQSLVINTRNDDVNINQPKIGEFLQRCYYCKKRISLTSEVYMYKDLCAFCSVECRDIHMSVDRDTEKKEAV